MSSVVDRGAEAGGVVLRRLSSSLADAFTADDVARATLGAVSDLPGVARAGLALNDTGGRELRFVSTGEDSLTPTRVQWCSIDAFADVPLVTAVRTGRHIYASSLDVLQSAYPGVVGRQRELGTRSMAALPLSTETETVGGLLLCFSSDQPFGPEQRWALTALSAQVTQSLRKGLAFQAQRTTAEQLQRSLLPRTLPDLPGLELGSHYRSGGRGSEVGGDWYDVIELPDGSTAVALGDVMGKGTAAAVAMSEMRAAVRAYVALDPTPSTVLERLDAFVSSQPGAQLVTLAYGIVAADRSAVTLALAGHPPPLVVTPGEGVAVVQEDQGSALGVGAGPWPSSTVPLGPGRVLLLYSDGLVETRGRELTTGIGDVVRHLEDLPARRCQPRELCARVAALMTDDDTDDDVTLLAVAATPTSGVRRTTWTLPDDATAPGAARRFLTSTLQGWGVDEDAVYVAELCVSELVTNAVIHTGTAAELTVRLDTECLTVLVRDGGGSSTVHRAADPEDVLAVSGRGLALVEAMSAAWATERGADGTTVWFELDAG